MYEVKSITDSSFTDQMWESYYDYMVASSERYGSSFVRSSWSEYKKRMLYRVENERPFHKLVFFDDGKPAGWLNFNIRNIDTDKRLDFFLCDGLFDKIPVDFSRAVAKQLHILMDEYNSASVYTLESNTRIADVIVSWGSDILGHIEKFVLRRDEANHDLMRQWILEIPQQFPELHAEFCKTYPVDRLDEYARLFTKFLRDMPKEEQKGDPFHVTADDLRKHMATHRKSNMHPYHYFLFHDDGRIIGFSHAYINSDDPRNAYQAMTGIIDEYRGRNLSKWLKAALFYKLGEDFPENKTMTSEMRSVNAPIIKVNEQIGYKLVSKGIEANITREILQVFLNKQ